jgi:hypothetical protein
MLSVSDITTTTSAHGWKSQALHLAARIINRFWFSYSELHRNPLEIPETKCDIVCISTCSLNFLTDQGIALVRPSGGDEQTANPASPMSEAEVLSALQVCMLNGHLGLT